MYHCTWSRFFLFWQDLVSATPTCLDAASWSIVVEALLIQFPGWIIPCVIVYSLHSWEEVSSYATILKLGISTTLFKNF